MKNFKYWDDLHKNESLEEFSTNRIGLLWLKTKSIIRKELIDNFIHKNGITLKQTSLKLQFVELFELLTQNIDKAHKLLDEYIKTISNQQIENIDIQQLVSELYKLKNFEWGGDYQNSLDHSSSFILLLTAIYIPLLGLSSFIFKYLHLFCNNKQYQVVT